MNKFSAILYGLHWAFKYTAWKHEFFRDRLKEKNLTVQIRVADDSIGRTFYFKKGAVSSRSGVIDGADVDIAVKDAALGAELMMPPIDHLKRIEAIKSFSLMAVGDDKLVTWFSETVYMIERARWVWGTPVENGAVSYTHLRAHET